MNKLKTANSNVQQNQTSTRKTYPPLSCVDCLAWWIELDDTRWRGVHCRQNWSTSVASSAGKASSHRDLVQFGMSKIEVRSHIGIVVVWHPVLSASRLRSKSRKNWNAPLSDWNQYWMQIEFGSPTATEKRRRVTGSIRRLWLIVSADTERHSAMVCMQKELRHRRYSSSQVLPALWLRVFLRSYYHTPFTYSHGSSS